MARLVVIDIPIAKYREVGQYGALIWAQLFQRAVDRRSYEAPDGRPVFLWEDEAHYFTIEQDALFQTTARSKGISVVRLTQNLPNFLDAYGRDGKHKVDTLLGNHATKIFHRNGDPTKVLSFIMNDAHQTPLQEAISFLTIGAILVGVGCYVAATQNVPVASPALFWVASMVYHWFPGLYALRAPQMPMLVSAAAVGGAFFVVGIPFASLLATWFSSAHMASLERQTDKLRRNRIGIQKRHRDRDGYEAN